MTRKQFRSIQPDTHLQFRLSKDLHEKIEAAAKFLDMTKSTLMRKAVREFLGLYYPEAFDPNVSVIEPHQLKPSQLPPGWNG